MVRTPVRRAGIRTCCSFRAEKKQWSKKIKVSRGRREAEQQNWLNCSFIINMLHYKYFPLLGSLGLLHFLPETPNLESTLN